MNPQRDAQVALPSSNAQVAEKSTSSSNILTGRCLLHVTPLRATTSTQDNLLLSIPPFLWVFHKKGHVHYCVR